MANTITAGNSTNNGTVVASDTTGILNINTGTGAGTTAITVDASQNVAIGATTTGVKLNVSQVDTSVGVLFNGTTRAIRFGFNTTGSTIEGVDNTGVTSYQPLIVGGADVRFTTSATERMRLDSAGNFIVGNTAAGFGGRVEIAKSGERCLVLHNTATGSAANAIQDFYRNAVQVGSITTTNANTTYGTSSDYRLKENVQPMVGALNKVAQLNPCTYTWKIDGSEGQGFIAHELQAVVPDAVVGEKDAVNEDGSIKPQNIDTSYLVATLTAAIQELKAELDALKAKVGA